MTIGSPPEPNEPAERGPVGFARLWAWLSRCEHEGCDARPVHLGWCELHAPPYEPVPDEYWGDGHGGDRRRRDEDEQGQEIGPRCSAV